MRDSPGNRVNRDAHRVQRRQSSGACVAAGAGHPLRGMVMPDDVKRSVEGILLGAGIGLVLIVGSIVGVIELLSGT